MEELKNKKFNIGDVVYHKSELLHLEHPKPYVVLKYQVEGWFKQKETGWVIVSYSSSIRRTTEHFWEAELIAQNEAHNIRNY